MKLIHGEGASSEMHLEYRIPTRGIMGLKNVLMAKTRGTAILHHVFAGYETADEKALVVAPHGSLVAFEQGTSTAYALFMTQERGELFIGPSVEVYQGMIVGENSREDDMDVNTGDILEGVSLADKGQEIFEAFIRVASGEQTKSEALGFGGVEFVPWQIGAVM